MTLLAFAHPRSLARPTSFALAGALVVASSAAVAQTPPPTMAPAPPPAASPAPPAASPGPPAVSPAPTAPAAPPPTTAPLAPTATASAAATTPTASPAVATTATAPMPPAESYTERARNPTPLELAWRPGEVIPPGYAPYSRPNTGLLVGGSVAFGTVYLPSFVTAWVGMFGGVPELTPLFIPVVGPLVSLGTLEAEDAGAYVLALNAGIQALGVTLFAMSFLDDDAYLRRIDGKAARAVPPSLDVRFTGTGAALEVTF